MPSAPSSAGQEAIDLAASAGLMLEPAQQLVLHGALGERRDGRWAAAQVVVVKPRQNGKDAIAEAREIGGLYLFGERHQTHTAHRYDTVQTHFRRVSQLCQILSDQTGDRRLKLKRVTSGNDHAGEEIELMSGQRIWFKTRSKLSGRGPSPAVVYLNEAMYLSELGSIVPSMSAQDAPQLWWLGSAPIPKPESDSLRKIMRLCREQATSRKRYAGRIAYFEWSAHVDIGPRENGPPVRLADVDITNRRLWAQANPGLGRRITAEFIADTEIPAMTHDEFCTERLGLYEDHGTAIEQALPAEAWAACRAPASTPIDPVVLAFEVSPDRKWSVIGVAAASTAGGTHVEVVDNRRGTHWVVDRLIELRDRWHPRAIACLPTGPAGGLVVDCEAKGLDIEAVTSTDYAKACASAYDSVTDGRWRHLGQPELDKAVSGAEKRTTGDTWVFDRREVDISPLVAVTLAAWIAAHPPETEIEPTVHEWADDDEEFLGILEAERAFLDDS